MGESLSEEVVIQRDDDYRRKTKFIVIASVESLVPRGYVLDPSIYGGGDSTYTWGRVQKFFTRYPGARRKQLPMHWYSEYLDDDYVSYVGLPMTNRSWWIQEQVRLGSLPIQYLDSFLIVIQENLNLEAIEKQLWRHLSHQVISPLLRELTMDRQRVVFFERVADRRVVLAPDYPYLFEEPTNLDENFLDLYLKEYGKR